MNIGFLVLIQLVSKDHYKGMLFHLKNIFRG